MQVILDTKKLSQLEREVPGRTHAIMRKIAGDFETDVKNSFTAISPSSPGEPPAVDEGNLKNSIRRNPVPGGFEVTDYVNYGVFLEFGTVKMAARPFMLPAFMRAIHRLPAELKRIIK